MSNYKKLANCPKTFLITYHNEAIDDAQLYVYEYPANNSTEYGYTLYAHGNIPGIRKDVYLGYEDANNIFEGNLSSVMTADMATLDSDVTGCSAKLSKNDTTGASIKFSLNKCTKDRIITFSYKNTPIFKIKQTYYTESTTPSLLYAVYVYGLTNINTANTFAWFMPGAPNSFSVSSLRTYLQFTLGNGIDINKKFLVFWYTDDKKNLQRIYL